MGALALGYVLWRTGGLAPGHWFSRTTAEAVSAPGEPPASALPTIPFPTAPAAEAGAAPAVAPAPVFSPAPTASPIAATPLAGFTLASPGLMMPVAGARSLDLHDDFGDVRGTRKHEAIDILAPRGTPVVAAVDGSIEKLFTSKQGGLTVYEFDREREYCYYYAHLDRYAEGLKEGQSVHRGDRIGYVGTTGNAPPERPHLHFAVFRLGPAKQWWVGTPINPYPLLLGNR